SPLLLTVPIQGKVGLLAVLATGTKARLLGPDLVVRKVELTDVRALLFHEVDAESRDQVTAMLDAASIPKRQHAKAREIILRQQSAETPVGRAWSLRLSPGTSFRHQLRHAGVLSRLLGLLGAHFVYFTLWVLGWWVLGQSALDGIFDQGW